MDAFVNFVSAKQERAKTVSGFIDCKVRESRAKFAEYIGRAVKLRQLLFKIADIGIPAESIARSIFRSRFRQ